MFRKVLSTLALGMILVAPAAHADDPPFTSAFWYNATGASTEFDKYTGSFTSASTGFFQVFCVNPNLFVSDPDSYNTWVTPFDAVNGSHTVNPNGNTWLGNYLGAAKIASLLFENANTNIYNDAQVISIQEAIWCAMGFAGHCDGNYGTWTAAYNARAAAGFAINPNNWLVITSLDKQKQEFISFVDTPFETVPEPATMTLLATGLAGMAAARRRRNSKN